MMSTAIAVVVGNQGAHYLETAPVKLIVGIGFIAIGVWILVEHFRGA